MSQVSTQTTTRGAPARTAAATEAPTGGEITIERLILHHLDSRGGNLLLVDDDLALDDAVRTLFTHHIVEAHERADWQARFREPDGEMPLLCLRLLSDGGAFVEISRELARRLFDQMCLRPNQIAPGDFVIVRYRLGEVPAAALFKLDPDARLARDFRRVNGRLRAQIQRAENLLPEVIRFQKCALLREIGGDFDIVLLDRQAGPRSEGVAAFFYRGFLTAEILPSARRRTRLFLSATESWLAARAGELEPPELFHFFAVRRTALAGEMVDVRWFAREAMRSRPPLSRDLLASVTEAVFDAGETERVRFAVDRATANPVVRYVTLELDGGARLRVDASRFDELVRVGPRREGGKLQLHIGSLTVREGSGA